MKNTENEQNDAAYTESSPLHAEQSEPSHSGEKQRRNECGICTLCCKLVAVEEIEKPVGSWCPHCLLGKGCKIYDARPTECQTWNCLWLQGAFGDQPGLRPDKCKVVVGYQAGFIMAMQDTAPRETGLRLIETLKASGKPMMIKRFGQPGVEVLNATIKEALQAGVIGPSR
ncbi:MAG TPA: hypothetical protein VGG64_10820 [Pirellulales bacterium]